MENQESQILLETENYVIWNKKAGEICESWTNKSENPKDLYIPSILDALKEKETGKKKEEIVFECVNRLDRPVSGVVLIAKNTKAFAMLTNVLNNKEETLKEYWAIVSGIIPSQKEYQLLSDFIYFDTKKRKSFIVDGPKNKAKPAKLMWKSLGAGDRYSFLSVKLITGRTHQIRAQLAKKGYYIKGDVKYGARRSDTLDGIRLHAAIMEFADPFTKKELHIEAPLWTVDPLWQAYLEAYKTDKIS
jgi:23S rRNA pseudouridine1911/1915/1917 synthase